MMTSGPQHNTPLDSALDDAVARFASANAASLRLSQEREPVMPGGNTRTTIHFDPFPVVIERGEGPWLIDADGHRYADFLNEYSAGLFGHSNPVIQDAVRAAIDMGMGFGAPNLYEGRLAGHIVSRFPSIEKLRFCNSGTEANLLALGTARAVTGRNKVMVFDGAYHGSLFYFHHHPSPINAPIEAVIAPFNDAEGTAAMIREHADDLAAVIVEPMQGGAGCLAGTSAFLAALRALCTEHGIVLIFDEVMTSRLSTGGQQKNIGVTPDMTTLGKYIGGGFTLAAFGGAEPLMRRFDPRRADAFPHGGTFNNNLLAMVAGCCAFEVLLTEEALGSMNRLGERLRDRLNAFAAVRGLPFQMTGVGSLIGVHFQSEPIRNDSDLAQSGARAARASDLQRLMHFELLENGCYTARRGYLALSLATTVEQIDKLGDAIEAFLIEREPLLHALDRL